MKSVDPPTPSQWRAVNTGGVGGTAPLRVLLVQHCANRTGSTISGHLVAQGFRHAGWEVDVAFGFDGPMIAEYARLGCRTHIVPHKSWLRGGNLVQSARRIATERRNAAAFRRLIGDLRPDVVYVNSLVGLAAATAAKREQIPCVWHIRELFDDVGGEMMVPAFGGRRLVRGMLNRLATRRVAISRFAAENILETTDPSRVEIVPNAVGDEFFGVGDDADTCRQKFGLPTGVPVVGVPGTLRPVKGHPFFLEAAAQLTRARPDCIYALTGSGETGYLAELQDKLLSLRLQDRVRFVGTVTDMPRFLRACDIACVPSQSESFGRTVIEAFAVGTPVVATSVGGMTEIIDSGVTGILTAYRDVEGLAARLLQLLHQPSFARQLSLAANQQARTRFSAAAHRYRLNAIVSDACCKDPPPRSVLPGLSDCGNSRSATVD